MLGLESVKMYQDNEKCDFCGSVMLISHSEGVTCSDCSRVGGCMTYPQPHTTPLLRDYQNIKSCEEVIQEITNRVGISEYIVDRSLVLLGVVKQIFKSKSIGDLVLICVYQAYREKRLFISFYRLREYYPTNSSISTLNNLFYKLTSSKIFSITQPYTYLEIIESLASYFRIPNKFIILIEQTYNEISKTLKYDSTPIKIACAMHIMSIRNMFYDCASIHEVFHFLCVKKSTVLVKIRKYKKLLISK